MLVDDGFSVLDTDCGIIGERKAVNEVKVVKVPIGQIFPNPYQPRKSFDEALNVTGTCPENSLLYVALGAALYADKEFVLTEVAAALDKYAATATYASEPPLFASKEEIGRAHV